MSRGKTPGYGMCSWEQLPKYMRTKETKEFYDLLCKKRGQLAVKRVFDVVVASLLLALLSPFLLALSVWIKADSKGPVFFRQVRITQYGRKFRIFKFRTMVQDAQKLGSQVTVDHDARITHVGEMIRKYRLDEIPQLLNVLAGDMTFVGTRPEVEKYVRGYTKEMMATLLLPAGITSEASIAYKDEDKLLAEAENIDDTYIHKVLPEKMKFNLRYMKKFSCILDVKICFQTIFGVMK